MSISQFVASFIVGYITSWQLSLVLTAMLPLLGIGGWFMAKAMDQGQASNDSYVNAGAMSQEILKEIKTVASFANFEYEKEKYHGYIDNAMKAGIKQGFKAGFGIGFIVFIVYNSYALAVGYGSYLIANKSTNKNSGEAFGAGDVITVLFSIIFGCFSLGQATPYINAILSACTSAKGLFTLLARQPMIDLSTSKEKPDKNNITGRIIFKNVTFAYPSKPGDLILDNLSFVIEPGQKVAIVGESGSGKSTVLSLIERLYDPQSGEILFDDFSIKNLDLEYLRSLIGYVPQQPVLLNTSIKENIIFGRKGISNEDIDLAIKNVYAKNFVDQKGLEYYVGAGGKMLSGGQKQRIAIARSIVNKPKILIFDEATSALDNKTEKEVQSTLDQVCKGLSSITVAHRITTIRNADKIICLDSGKVIEEGSHKELLQKNDFYAHLINEYIETESDEEDYSDSDLDGKREKNLIYECQNEGEDIIEYDEEKVEINRMNEYENNKKEEFYPVNGNFNMGFNQSRNENFNSLNDNNHSNINKRNITNKAYNEEIKGILKNRIISNFDKKFYDEKIQIENVINLKDNLNIETINKNIASSQNLINNSYCNSKVDDLKNDGIRFDNEHIDEINNQEKIFHPFDLSLDSDQKIHKAENEYDNDNNSINDSGIEIKNYNKQFLILDKSVTGKNESLLGNSKEKTIRSNRSNGNNIHLKNLEPDQQIEIFNSQKDGYLQINDEKCKYYNFFKNKY